MHAKINRGLLNILFLVVCIILTACQSPQAVDATPAGEDSIGCVESSFTVRSKEYRLSFPNSKIRSSPAWRMRAAENPKLLPGRAVYLARGVLASAFSDADAWDVESVCIFPSVGIRPETGTPFSGDRWYYLVVFTPPEPQQFSSGHYVVCVLMDGTVVAPQESR